MSFIGDICHSLGTACQSIAEKFGHENTRSISVRSYHSQDTGPVVFQFPPGEGFVGANFSSEDVVGHFFKSFVRVKLILSLDGSTRDVLVDNTELSHDNTLVLANLAKRIAILAPQQLSHFERELDDISRTHHTNTSQLPYIFVEDIENALHHCE